jgi:hypothetical protein
MDPEQLRRFDPFAGLAAHHLEPLAREACILVYPPRRWLVRPGRRLPGYYFLLEGRLRVHDDRGVAHVVEAGSAEARNAVYPAWAGVATLSSVSLVHFVTSVSAGETADVPGCPEVIADERSWQVRFLASPLLRRLTPVEWQRLLRAMRRLELDAGEPLIRQGDRADACYVLAAGRARVHREGRELALLAPGDLCGEDALITGERRNASITFVEAGAAMALDAARFAEWLLGAVARGPAAPAPRMPLSLDPGAVGAAWLPLSRLRDPDPGLDPAVSYGITGATEPVRWLAAFVLSQRGFDAVPMRAADPGAVRRGPSAPLPSSAAPGCPPPARRKADGCG